MYEGLKIISYLSKICQNYLKEVDSRSERDCLPQHVKATGSLSGIPSKTKTNSSLISSSSCRDSNLCSTQRAESVTIDDSAVNKQKKEKGNKLLETEPFEEVECCGIIFKYASHLARHRSTLKHQSVQKCRICQEYFPSDEAKKAHEAEIHLKAGDLFLCKICNSSFKTKGNCDRHVETVHLKTEVFTCAQCGSHFTRKDGLVKHLLTHAKDRERLPCSTCGLLFNSKSNLVAHVQKICSKGRHQCKTCFRTFKDEDDLQTHSKIHIPGYLFRCMICGQGFCTFEHREKHLATHSFHPSNRTQGKEQNSGRKGKRKKKKKVLTAKIVSDISSDQLLPRGMKKCDKSSVLPHTLVNSEEKYKCKLESSCSHEQRPERRVDDGSSMCLKCHDVPSDTEQILPRVSPAVTKEPECILPDRIDDDSDANWIDVETTESIEMDQLQSIQIQVNESPLDVDRGLEDNSATVLNLHNNFQSEESELISKPVPRSRSGDKVLHMNHSKPSSSDTSVQTEMRRNDRNGGVETVRLKTKVFTCGQCGSHFEGKDGLEKHLLIHVEDKNKFPCSICGLSFRTSRSLKAHVQNICSKGKHQCKKCFRTYSDKDDLERHSKMHIPGYVFRCMVCGRVFSKYAHREKHLETHSFHLGKSIQGKKQNSKNRPERKQKKEEILNAEIVNDVSSDQLLPHVIKKCDKLSVLQHIVVNTEENFEYKLESSCSHEQCIQRRVDEGCSMCVMCHDVPCSTEHLLPEVDSVVTEESECILPDRIDDDTDTIWIDVENDSESSIKMDQFQSVQIQVNKSIVDADESLQDNTAIVLNLRNNFQSRQSEFLIETTPAQQIVSKTIPSYRSGTNTLHNNLSKRKSSGTNVLEQRGTICHKEKSSEGITDGCDRNDESNRIKKLQLSVRTSVIKHKHMRLSNKDICCEPQFLSNLGRDQSTGKVLNERNQTIFVSDVGLVGPIHISGEILMSAGSSEDSEIPKHMKSHSYTKLNIKGSKATEPVNRTKKRKRQSDISRKCARKRDLADVGPEVYVENMFGDDDGIFLLPEFFAEERTENSKPSELYEPLSSSQVGEFYDDSAGESTYGCENAEKHEHDISLMRC